MDKVLLQHLDVCFGQAMSVVVACVVYVTAKLLQANVTFKMVTEVSLTPEAYEKENRLLGTPVWSGSPALCRAALYETAYAPVSTV
jgi:hypothetical protein